MPLKPMPSRPGHRVRHLTGLLLVLLCAGQAAYMQMARAADSASAPHEYSVAVLPVIPPSEIKRRWQPVLDQLGRDTGMRFRFRYYAGFSDFENSLMHDEADLAVVTPVQMWLLRTHYRPLLRSKQPLSGLVVVKSGYPAKTLADLQGKSVGLQEGENLPASLLVRRALREQKTDVDLKFMSSETNALRSVVLGKTDAAITSNYILKLMPAGFLQQIRVIHQAPDMPSPPLASSLRLSPEETARVRTAILNFRERHRALLESILMPDIVEADLERDYAVIAKLLQDEKPQ